MKKVTTFATLSLLMSGALLLSGCGMTTTTTGTGVTVQEILSSGNISTGTILTGMITEQANVFVAIRDSAFSPETVNIKVGTKITWRNRDSVSHAISGSGIFASGPLAQDAEYSYTFDKAGTYSYICSIHPNMKGTIVVTN